MAVFATPPTSPMGRIIAEQLQKVYLNGNVNDYINILSKKDNLSEEDIEKTKRIVKRFFESDQFVETAAAYLTALFSESELAEINQDMKAGLLIDEYIASPASSKLNRILKKLKPYLIEYLERKSR